jgi:hypothetical protein
VQRYIGEHNGALAGIFRCADELHEDPLHGFLVVLMLFVEMMADPPAAYPGCLVSSSVYQEQLLRR